MIYTPITLTNKEKDNIDDLLTRAAREMQYFYRLNDNCSIVICVEIKSPTIEETEWKLYITDTDITMRGKNSKDERALMNNGIVMFSRNAKSQSNVNNCYEFDLDFLAQYPKIRQDIINLITKNRDEVKIKNELQPKKDDDINLEINFNDLNSINKIIITEEKGRTVGTVIFPNQIVKILTDNDIILVTKEPEKQKEREGII